MRFFWDIEKYKKEKQKTVEMFVPFIASELEKCLPIKFYIGSWFEYNNTIYVLTEDKNGEPHFEKMNKPEWIKRMHKKTE